MPTPTRVTPQTLDSNASSTVMSDSPVGDQAALERSLIEAMPRLNRWAHRHMSGPIRNQMDPADLAQEAALRAIAYMPRFKWTHEHSMGALLKQIAINRARDEVRRIVRRGEHAEVTDALASDAAGPLELAIQRERTVRYHQALAGLRDVERRLISARAEGHSYAAMALSLGLPSADAARMALTRATGKLKSEVLREARRGSIGGRGSERAVERSSHTH